MRHPAAILCSDIHLSHNPPVARSAEPDWYAAMARQIRQVKDLCCKDNRPLIIAGDIFDKWHANRTPELVHFAVQEFGDFPDGVYAVPGQHDLPNHRVEEKHRSAYGLLSICDVIIDLERPKRTGTRVSLHPFAWGSEIKPLEKKYNSDLQVAVVHKYIWEKDCTYPGADETEKVTAYRDRLKGYDVAVFGDNHKGFIAKQDGKYIMNCGTFFRRTSDEVDYKPMVGILFSDGSIEPHYLDVSKDKFIEKGLAQEKEQQELDVSKFIDELNSLHYDELDFRDALEHFMKEKDTCAEVRDLVLQSIE